MADFTYNNAKNISANYIPLELYCGFYLQVLFEQDVDPSSRFCLVNKLADELRELINTYCQNLLHAYK